jgi:hypothetical protein
VAIYHVVFPHEGFEDAGRALFQLVRRAQAAKPGRRRMLFLDIEGHRHADGGFDADMRELQQEFLFDVLAPFLTEAHCPLLTLRNPVTRAPRTTTSPRTRGPDHRACPTDAVVTGRGQPCR